MEDRTHEPIAGVAAQCAIADQWHLPGALGPGGRAADCRCAPAQSGGCVVPGPASVLVELAVAAGLDRFARGAVGGVRMDLLAAPAGATADGRPGGRQ